MRKTLLACVLLLASLGQWACGGDKVTNPNGDLANRLTKTWWSDLDNPLDGHAPEYFRFYVDHTYRYVQYYAPEQETDCEKGTWELIPLNEELGKGMILRTQETGGDGGGAWLISVQSGGTAGDVLLLYDDPKDPVGSVSHQLYELTVMDSDLLHNCGF